MERNIGTLDATLRITLGLLGLAYGIGRMSRRPYRTPWVLMSMSAMKIAEGTTRFCPMLYVAGMSTREEQASLFRPKSKAKTKDTKDNASEHGKSEHGKMEDQIIKAMASEIEEALHASPSQSSQKNPERSNEQSRREGMYARRARRIGTDYQQQELRSPNH